MDESKLSGDKARIYTTADPILDGDNTETVEPVIGQTRTGKPVRLVETPAELLQGQLRGYQAQMETALTEHEWRIELQFGNVSEGDEDAG